MGIFMALLTKKSKYYEYSKKPYQFSRIYGYEENI
jgi:hypothetical protein